jgi:hypothetical protein
MMILAASAALALSACTESSESYQIGASEAWSKLSSAGYSIGTYGLPMGLKSVDVRSTFESFPGDRTAYWKFVRNGTELGRINLVVEGDQSSSTVSMSYAKGNVSGEDAKLEPLLRQYAQPLFVDAVDAAIEGRAREEGVKSSADMQSMTQTSGMMMNDMWGKMGKRKAESKEMMRQVQGQVAVQTAQHTSTRPTTSLSSY